MTLSEQSIYNTHLAVSRQAKGKPFKLRRDFSKIDATKSLATTKIEKLLSKYPHIAPNDFFKAPYELYEDTDYFDLAFYTTPAAIKAYTLFKRKQQLASADNEDTIKRVQESMMFVYRYCKSNDLTLDEYPNHIEGTMPAPLVHLKHNHITFYTLHGLNIYESLKVIDNELLEFFIPDFWSLFQSSKTKYLSSKKQKTIVNKSKKLLTLTLAKQQNQV